MVRHSVAAIFNAVVVAVVVVDLTRPLIYGLAKKMSGLEKVKYRHPAVSTKLDHNTDTWCLY